MGVKGKLPDKIKDKKTYQKFLRQYEQLVKEIEQWEKEQSELHQQILNTIDQKKMNKVLSRIKNIKDN